MIHFITTCSESSFIFADTHILIAFGQYLYYMYFYINAFLFRFFSSFSAKEISSLKKKVRSWLRESFLNQFTHTEMHRQTEYSFSLSLSRSPFPLKIDFYLIVYLTGRSLNCCMCSFLFERIDAKMCVPTLCVLFFLKKVVIRKILLRLHLIYWPHGFTQTTLISRFGHTKINDLFSFTSLPKPFLHITVQCDARAQVCECTHHHGRWFIGVKLMFLLFFIIVIPLLQPLLWCAV